MAGGPEQVQWRGGPEEESNVFIGRPKEITVNTTRWVMCLHDGITPGGYELGARGDMPMHEWDGTSIRFQGPTGDTWGEWIDLSLSITLAQIASIEAKGTTEIQRIVTEGGDVQLVRLQGEGTTQVGLVTTEGSNQVGLVVAEGSTQVGLVTNEGTTQVGLVIAEGTTQTGLVTAEGTAQIALVANGSVERVADVNTAGDTQVDRVTAEGDAQVAIVQEAADLTTLWDAVNLKLEATDPSVSTAKLTSSVDISLSGDATGSVSFDGSANVDIAVQTNSFINSIIFGG